MVLVLTLTQEDKRNVNKIIKKRLNPEYESSKSNKNNIY